MSHRAQVGWGSRTVRPWRALLARAPGLPAFLREALFYPPSSATPVAAAIFPDAVHVQRANALPSALRQRLERRLGEHYHLPFVTIAFLDQATVLAQLAADDKDMVSRAAVP